MSDASGLGPALFDQQLHGWALPPEIMGYVVEQYVRDFRKDTQAVVLPILLVCKELTTIALPQLYTDLSFTKIDPLLHFFEHSPVEMQRYVRSVRLTFMFASEDDGNLLRYDLRPDDRTETALQEVQNSYGIRLSAFWEAEKVTGMSKLWCPRHAHIQYCHPGLLTVTYAFHADRISIIGARDQQGLSLRQLPYSFAGSRILFEGSIENVMVFVNRVCRKPRHLPELRYVELVVTGYVAFATTAVFPLMVDVQEFVERFPDVTQVKLRWKFCHMRCEDGLLDEEPGGRDFMRSLDPRIRLSRCPPGTCPFSIDPRDIVELSDDHLDPVDDLDSPGQQIATHQHPDDPIPVNNFFFAPRTKDEDDTQWEGDEDIWELEEGELDDLEAQKARFDQIGWPAWETDSEEE